MDALTADLECPTFELATKQVHVALNRRCNKEVAAAVPAYAMIPALTTSIVCLRHAEPLVGLARRLSPFLLLEPMQNDTGSSARARPLGHGSDLSLSLLCVALCVSAGCAASERMVSSMDGSIAGDAALVDASTMASDATTADTGSADGPSDATISDGEIPSKAADGSAENPDDASSAEADGAAAPDGRCAGGFAEGRLMECLDRGVLALTTEDGAFVSWRLFGTDPADISFHLYREAAGGTTQVCQVGPGSGTWCTDPAPPADSQYFVRPVIAGAEGAPSGSSPLQAQDYLRIPLEPTGSDAIVHLAWVGDLDGDGEYDVVVDRISASAPLATRTHVPASFCFAWTRVRKELIRTTLKAAQLRSATATGMA